MICKHCKSKIGIFSSIINQGFCSKECQIANRDLNENTKFEKKSDGYKFQEVRMGSLKKSKENLEKGKEELKDNNNQLKGGNLISKDNYNEFLFQYLFYETNEIVDNTKTEELKKDTNYMYNTDGYTGEEYFYDSQLYEVDDCYYKDELREVNTLNDEEEDK